MYMSRSIWHHIGDIMVSVLASGVVDRGLEPRSSQTKDYKIGICCFSTIKARSIKEKEQRLVGLESGY
jgi:hypothetical protein